jgi:hypothetical protein
LINEILSRIFFVHPIFSITFFLHSSPNPVRKEKKIRYQLPRVKNGQEDDLTNISTTISLKKKTALKV